MPELASRQHVRDICGVVERALADGGASWRDVDALAVTQGPGLVGSLLVGVSFAKAAAWALDKPLVAVNHLAGHIESIWLEHGPIPLPASCWSCRAGTPASIWSEREGEYQLLGRTRDDAAGEAYDKVAKLLSAGLSGRADHRSAGAQEGDDTAIRWPGTRLTNPDRNAPERDGRFDFSFSGLKTAVLRHVRAAAGRRSASSSCRTARLSTSPRAFSAASSRRWSTRRSPRRAGTARNRSASPAACRRIRACARTRCAKAERSEIPVYIPRLSLSTDNAAMIAAAGLRKLAAGRVRAGRSQRRSIAAALNTDRPRRHGGTENVNAS